MPLPVTGNGWIFCAAGFPSSYASGVKLFAVSLLCVLYKKNMFVKKKKRKKESTVKAARRRQAPNGTRNKRRGLWEG
jgi:hypothetical protein